MTLLLWLACSAPTCTSACASLVERCDAAPFADTAACVAACRESLAEAPSRPDTLACYAAAACDLEAVVSCATAVRAETGP